MKAALWHALGFKLQIFYCVGIWLQQNIQLLLKYCKIGEQNIQKSKKLKKKQKYKKKSKKKTTKTT